MADSIPGVYLWPEDAKVPCPVCGAEKDEFCRKGEKGSDRWHFAERFYAGHQQRFDANGIINPNPAPPRQKLRPTPGSDVE